MKVLAALAAALCGILLLAQTARADSPPREEQFVYALIVYNGKDYSSTFVREPSNDLYLMADTNNFLSARKVFVYYWALSGNFRLDTDTLNRRLDGTLHIVGNGIVRDLDEKIFTYYNLRGEYELNWHVAEGAEALAIGRDYDNLVAQFAKEQDEYQKAVFTYEARANELAERINALRAKGADAHVEANELGRLFPPVAPVPSQKYAAPPAPIQQAFIINLPEGVYHLSLTNPDGTTMQGSEKRLIVFRQHVENRVGYEVIPGDKWTRPETSRVPVSALYVDGSADLYLRPFYEAEYGDYQYARLVDNDGTGNRNLTQWVRLQQVPAARVLVASSAGSSSVSEQQFAIDQSAGQALGYTIVPWGQEQRRPGEKPDIVAFHVPVKASAFSVATLDGQGRLLPGSERQVRLVTGPGREALLLIAILFPIACMLVILAVRARWYRAHNRPTQRS